MKQISIVFSKRTAFNPFSLLIMFGLKTPFSHVSIKMTDGDTNQIVYYQASGLEVNCVSEAEFLSLETIVYQKNIQASDSVFVTGKTFSINQLGKPYDILAIFGFALQILLGTVNIKINNPFKANGSQFVCSQFAGAYIDTCENIKMDITNMTPATLYETIPVISSNWV
jgi:hypothetical protein